MASRFVYSVQSFLKWKGINPGPLDGDIGPQTIAAWNKFLDVVESKPTVPPPPDVPSIPDGNVSLKLLEAAKDNVGKLSSHNAQGTEHGNLADASTLPSDGSDFARFSKFLLHSILPSECAYVKGSKERIPEDVTWEDVPGDSGGVTKWGVDQSSHRGVDIKNLSLADAEAIYYKEWEEHKCNLLPTPIAEVVFDTFTTGGHPIVWLQEVLGVTVDAALGPNTLGEAAKSDPLNTANSFLVKRDQYFTSLADSVSHDRKFLAGWLNRDKNLKAYIATLV
jgi:lysozyme family protein